MPIKFWTSIGPNPQIVKICIKELGITDLETVTVDLLAGENRKPPYNESINVSGQTPALQMENGKLLTEVTAICEYLNDKYNGDLFGSTPEERAEVHMWNRRIDFNLEMPIFNGYRFGEGKDFFAPRLKVIPQASDDLKAIGQERTMWLDKIMSDGRKYLCGDKLTAADLWLYVVLTFGAAVGQPINPEAKNVLAFVDRLKDRESIVKSPVMEP